MRSECLAALGLVIVVACHHDNKNACVEGASVACACADGASGAQVCKANDFVRQRVPLVTGRGVLLTFRDREVRGWSACG